jgi:hypothetical protein
MKTPGQNIPGFCLAERLAWEFGVIKKARLAAKRMIERSMQRFNLYPARLMGDRRPCRTA